MDVIPALASMVNVVPVCRVRFGLFNHSVFMLRRCMLTYVASLPLLLLFDTYLVYFKNIIGTPSIDGEARSKTCGI